MSASPSASHSAETLNQSTPEAATRSRGRTGWTSASMRRARGVQNQRTPAGRSVHAAANVAMRRGASLSHQPTCASGWAGSMPPGPARLPSSAPVRVSQSSAGASAVSSIRSNHASPGAGVATGVSAGAVAGGSVASAGAPPPAAGDKAAEAVGSKAGWPRPRPAGENSLHPDSGANSVTRAPRATGSSGFQPDSIVAANSRICIQSSSRTSIAATGAAGWTRV